MNIISLVFQFMEKKLQLHRKEFNKWRSIMMKKGEHKNITTFDEIPDKILIYQYKYLFLHLFTYFNY